MRSMPQAYILGLIIEVLLSWECSGFGIIVGLEGMEELIKDK